MDKQTLIATAISAAITLVVTASIGYFVGVFDKGMQASEKEFIAEVIEEKLVTADGKSHSAALASINTNLAVIGSRVEGIEGNLAEIREAMLELAAP